MGFDAREESAIAALFGDRLPYRRIAELLNLPASAVRRYAATLPEPQAQVPDTVVGWCPWCGSRLYQRTDGKTQRFCSDQHRRAWWACHPEARTRTATYTYTCAGCGKPFSAYGNKTRKYCTHACYVAHRSRP